MGKPEDRCSGRMQRGMLGWGNQRTSAQGGCREGCWGGETRGPLGRAAAAEGPALTTRARERQGRRGPWGSRGGQRKAGWGGRSALSTAFPRRPGRRTRRGNPQPLPHSPDLSSSWDRVRIMRTQTAHRKRLSSCNLASLCFLLSKQVNA